MDKLSRVYPRRLSWEPRSLEPMMMRQVLNWVTTSGLGLKHRVHKTKHWIRKAKAQMELNLAKDVKDDKKLYRYIGQKRQAKLRKEDWLQQTWRRLSYLVSYLHQSLLAVRIPMPPHIPEPLGEGWGSNIPYTVRAEQVWDHVTRLYVYKSMGLGDVHPRVLKELADVFAESCSIMSEKS